MVSIELATEIMNGFLRDKYHETHQNLEQAHIIELLRLCLKTYFPFNGQVYEQTEEYINNQLPFLDVRVTKLTNEKIRTNNTRRILHIRSNHSVSRKRSGVKILFRRVRTIFSGSGMVLPFDSVILGSTENAFVMRLLPISPKLMTITLYNIN
ncbi:unnamed protein product [Dibothriocephalus latus]|uniref:Uncharacterized protein n=1 Tax=Dibothriocephalus latus TaxID=60516 RepID=A0A3P6QVK4_DIBLA|nr:unnamed protein product [Dibothriocephalus latus]